MMVNHEQFLQVILECLALKVELILENRGFQRELTLGAAVFLFNSGF